MYEQFDKLWNLFRRQSLFVQSAELGIAWFLLGLGSLLILVSGFGVGKLLANACLSAVMTPLYYFVSKKLIWCDRKTSVPKGLSWWSMKWLTMGAVSQTSFVVFAGLIGLPYLAVRGGTAVALGVPSYFVNKEVVFKPQTRTEMA